MSIQRSSILVAAGALLTVVAVDVALRRVAPLPPVLIEVDDGVAAFRRANPETLVIGSSHTRSFAPVRDALDRELGGSAPMVLVPVEWGTFSAYSWVLEHRLQSLMQGEKARLRRVLLITTYYDICTKGELTNLPARAWTLGDFLGDVADNGITNFNRNYLQYHWTRSFPFSVLVQDRGHDRVIEGFKARLRTPATVELMRARSFAAWQAHIEEQAATCDDPTERAHYEATLDYLLNRGLDVTVVMFPLMKSSVTERARRTTVQHYKDYVAELRTRKHFQVVDMTLDHPLEDDDFQADFDHVTLAGNRKFAAWALAGPLQFLRSPAPPSGAAPQKAVAAP
jgi:hypothetical protein